LFILQINIPMTKVVYGIPQKMMPNA
jgi:hypothetical protein